MRISILWLSLFTLLSLILGMADVGVRLHDPETKTKIDVRRVGRYKLMISVDPTGGGKPILVDIDLPETGSGRWPVEDVIALDGKGKVVPLTRDGIEWGKLQLLFPPTGGVYFVQAMAPPKTESLFPEKERIVIDPEAGFKAIICRWFDGRRAALSLRFDDSHPSHLDKVIPTLRRYGFKGTFMINPGNRDYIEHKEEWERVAREGDQEFADHTLHHHGASSDDEAEREIGEVARYIRHLFPGRSTLLALNLGGGTKWATAKPFRYFLDKYHLFYISGSLGMDDVYGDRVEAFRRHLLRHIERGLWCRVHFHSIGEGMSTSEKTFLSVMEIVKRHEHELWIAGMSDIYKYQSERRAARLSLKRIGTDMFKLQLLCGTDPELYDQPLTIELTLPADWPPERVIVEDGKGEALQTRSLSVSKRRLLRFEAAPVDAVYIVCRRSR